MRRSLTLSMTLLAGGLALGSLGCAKSSWCADCDKVTPILGLNYLNNQVYVTGTAIAVNLPNPSGGTPTQYELTAGLLPAGLTLNPVTGVLSGTPTTAGVFTVTIQGANAANRVTQVITLTVESSAALRLGYDTPQVFPMSAGITPQAATLSQGTPGLATTYTLTGGALPAGLTLGAQDGAITGIPTALGVSTFEVTARNGRRTAKASATYTVTPASALVVNYPSPRTFPAGAGIAAQAPALANDTPGVPTTFALSAGSLPTGLVLNADGTITGTPTTPGVYAFTVTATNGTRTATSSPTYTVENAAALTLAYATPRVFPAGGAIAAQAATVGQETPGVTTTFAVTTGSLPAGLTLGANGAITGTPTVPGVYPFTVTATNGTRTAAASVSYTVETAGALTLAYATPRFFPANSAIAAQAATVGQGTPGVTSTFAVTTGALPPGLALGTSGTITGTPTTPGVYAFTVTATNGTRTATASVSYTVENAATLGLTYPTPQTFAPNVAIATQTPTVSNATTGVSTTYTVTSGSLPTGLVLNANGTITGTPTVAGTFTFTVTATNGTRTTSANVTYTVQSPAPTALNYATPVTYTSGFAISTNSPAPSGAAPTSYAITAGALPAGLSLDPATGDITGTPTVSGTFSVTVRGSNGAGNASQTLSLTVLAPITASLTANPDTVPVGQSSSLTPLFSGGTGSLDHGFGAVGTGGSVPTGTYASTGTTTYTLTVTNSAGASRTATATVTVTAAAPGNSVTIHVPTTGTTYSNSTPSDPLNGLAVTVPNQGSAVCAATDLTITRVVGGAMPGALASGVVAVSDPWIMSSTVGYPFRQPMTVTLPYDGSSLGASDLPVPFYWDPAYGQWVSLGLKSIDTVNKRVTFTTLLPGQYAVLAIPGLSASLSDQGLGFGSGTDSWYQPNQGTFDVPGGSSFGMGSFASWYFAMRKSTNGGAGLYSLLREGDANSAADDVSARALISRLANGTLDSWNALWTQSAYQLTDVQTGLALITGLRVTGQPQLFLMSEARPATDNAVATVITGFTQATGKFSVLDPNYPGMPLTITWNAGSGAFTSYDRAAGYVPSFTKYAFEGQPSIHRLTDYERVFAGATGGWATPPFATLAVTDVAGTGSVSGGGTAAVTGATNITVSGTVANGSDSATHIYWSQNGGSRTAVPLSGGAFSFTIPALADPYGTRVALETTGNPCDPTFSYSGYTEFTVKDAGRSAWFPNICFESGDTLPWTLQTGSNNGKAYPASPTFSSTTGEMNSYAITWSTDTAYSALVTVGADPNVPSISRVFDGSKALRTNHIGSQYHLSRVWQDIVVPNDVTWPKLTFYWAAVMQNAGHAASDQPYVDIIVEDVTNSYEVVYYKHFYANDPSYPGWIAGNGSGSSQWWGINWQQVTFANLTARKGHTLRIRVVGSDCNQGGHGGYAYLDGVNCN